MIPYQCYSRLADRYIGTPYKEDGWSIADGLFCYSLLWLFHRDLWNVELPRHPAMRAAGLVAQEEMVLAAIGAPASGWYRIDDAAAVIGDAVLTSVDGHQSHIGVVIGNNVMMHAYCAAGGRGVEGRVRASWIKTSKAQLDGFAHPTFYRHEAMQHV